MMTGVGAVIFGAGTAAFVALGVAVAAMGVALRIASLGIKPFAESLKLIGEIDGNNLVTIGAGLAAIGAGMLVFSAGMLAGTGAGILSGIASFFGAKSPLDKIKEFVPIAEKIALIGEAIKNFGEGIRELSKSTSEFNADAFSQIKDSISGFSIPREMSISNSIEQEKLRLKLNSYGLSSEQAESLMKTTQKAPDAARAAARSIEMASAYAVTPVGHHAVPVARPNQGGEVGDVQPVHLRDISDSILRDRAGSSGTGKVQSDELSRIEDASFRQVEELEQIRQGISELVGLMKPKGSGIIGGSGESGPGNTRDPRRPLHAAKFGKMKYGKVGGNANRSLVNNGES